MRYDGLCYQSCADVDGGSSPPDGGSSDAGTVDGGVAVDSGLVDGGRMDGGPMDAGSSDAGGDAGPPPMPLGVGCGADHSCTWTVDGRVFCWGSNTSGQIGNGSTRSTHGEVAPIEVTGLPGPVSAVVAGSAHTCALHGGSVSCWGDDSEGQIGDGGSETLHTSPTPVALPAGSTAVQISAGWQHSCAVLDDGTVVCWGSNASAQLGRTADSMPHSTPLAVTGLTDVAEVAAAGEHTCARHADGSVECWGKNNNGQLGRGSTTFTPRPTPAGVSGIDGTDGAAASMLAAGYNHTCAAVGSELRCWGAGGNGQLGDGTIFSRSAPVSVMGLASPELLALGGKPSYGTSCAATSTEALCWGRGNVGQLGDGMNGTFHGATTAQPVMGLPEVPSSIAVGATHACAIASDTLYCWGAGDRGQLGNGFTSESDTPVMVSFPP